MAIRLPTYQITQLPNSSTPPRLRGEIPLYYTALLAHYGPQNWWPARSRFEVIVGAYLTQNTNWSNVEKALLNLRRARRLGVKGIREAPLDELETLVRPSGYFRQKARNLKTFIAFLDRQYSGSLSRMFAQPTSKLRSELLELNGVGPETADSILLYAGNHPVFVVDAYTRRVLLRHGIIDKKTGYEEIRSMIEHAISSSETEALVRRNFRFRPTPPGFAHEQLCPQRTGATLQRAACVDRQSRQSLLPHKTNLRRLPSGIVFKTS